MAVFLCLAAPVAAQEPVDRLLVRLDAMADLAFDCLHEAGGWELEEAVPGVDVAPAFRRFVDPDQLALRAAVGYDRGRIVADIEQWQWGQSERQRLYYDGRCTVLLSGSGAFGAVHDRYYGGGVGPLCPTFVGVIGATTLATLIRDARARGACEAGGGERGEHFVIVAADGPLPGFRLDWDEAGERLGFAGIGSDLTFEVASWTTFAGQRLPAEVSQSGHILIEFSDGRRTKVRGRRRHRLVFSAPVPGRAEAVVRELRRAGCVSIRGLRCYSWTGLEQLLDDAAGSLAAVAGKAFEARPAPAGGPAAALEHESPAWPDLLDEQREIYEERHEANGVLRGFCVQCAVAVVARLSGDAPTLRELVGKWPDSQLPMAQIPEVLSSAGLGRWEAVAMKPEAVHALREVAVVVPLLAEKSDVHHAFVAVPGANGARLWDSARQRVTTPERLAAGVQEWVCFRRSR